MNHHGSLSSIVFCTVIALSGCDKQSTSSTATEDSNTPKNFEQFEAIVPKAEGTSGLYVVEGDILVSRDQLKAYWNSSEEAAKFAGRSQGTVYTLWNQDNTIALAARATGTLSYCIDNSFTDAERSRVRSLLTQSFSDWQSSADGVYALPFTFTETFPATCASGANGVYLVVKKITDQYINASASIPNTDVEQVLNIATGGLTQSDAALGKSMRHEIGHLLGFGHEHSHPGYPYTACTEKITPEQRGAVFLSFRAVTEYDPNSIMNYEHCSGATRTITTKDRLTARELYPNPGKQLFTSTTVSFPAGWNLGLNSTSWGISNHPATTFKPFLLDVNLDGYSDVLILGETHYYLALSNSSGAYSTVSYQYPDAKNYVGPVAGKGTSYSTILGDFNHDGKQDFRRLGATDFHTYTSLGNGTFSASTTNYVNAENFNPAGNSAEVAGHVYGEWASLGGKFEPYTVVNNNGTPTAVNNSPNANFARFGSSYVYAFVNGGNAIRVNYPADWGTSLAINYPHVAIDVDGTGKQAMVRIGYNNIYTATYFPELWSNPIVTGFQLRNLPLTSSVGGLYGYDSRFLVGDVNGDHRQELIAVGSTSARVFGFDGDFYGTTGGGQSVVLRSTTNGLPNSYALNSAYYADVVGDVNGDGRSDIVRVTSSMVRSFTANTASGFDIGTSANKGIQYITTGFSQLQHSEVLAGDADHNGKSDLFIVNSNSVKILKN